MKNSIFTTPRLLCFGLVLTAGLNLSSCGGDTTVSGASGSISAAMAPIAAGVFLSGAQGISLTQAPNTAPNIGGLNIPGFNAGSTFEAADENPLSACTTVTPENRVDEDSDGIAKEKYYVYDCNNVTLQDGFVVTNKGAISILDYDDTNPHISGGYKYDIDYQGQAVRVPTHDISYTHKGSFEAIRQGGSYIFSSVFGASFAGVDNDLTYDFTWRSNYKTAYTPDNMDLPWAAGAITINGFVALEGRVIPQQLESYEVAWEMSSVGLKYDYGACTTFKEGSLFWTDGAGEKFEVRFECTSYKTLFKGQEITPE